MRAASPPASATDLLDSQNERRSQRPLRRVSNYPFCTEFKNQDKDPYLYNGFAESNEAKQFGRVSCDGIRDE